MQFIDLKKQYTRLESEINGAIKKVLDHGGFIMGPEVGELEERLADFCGAKHCVSCSSGTDALLMPLMAWNIGPGDAVFMPSFTFFATAETVALLGAVPVFVDIDARTFNMDAAALEAAVTAVLEQNASIHPLPRAALAQKLAPRAIIPVDLFGMAADYRAILPIAEKHGLLVLEDAAQSFGGRYFEGNVCNLGCGAAATSFFPAKPLGCYGDGGAVFTNDDDLAEILRSIRAHGKGADKYSNCRLGLNGRLDTLQAAILLPKLAVLADEIQKRQEVAARYNSLLRNARAIKTPFIPQGVVSAYAQFSILTEEGARDSLMAALKAKGVPSNIYYPIPMHLLPVFASSGYKYGDFPVSERTSQSILALPFHPYMEREDTEKVCAAIEEALGQ